MALQQAGVATTRSGRRARKVLEGSGWAESYDESELKGRERWVVVPALAVMAGARLGLTAELLGGFTQADLW